MNIAHFHLMVNHAPLFGLVFGFIVFLFGLRRKSTDVLRAGLLLFVLAALLAIPAFLSGDGTADMVQNIQAVDKMRISPHEEAAKIALFLCCLIGAASLAGLWMLRTQRTLSKIVTASILLLAILAMVVTGYTAGLGGKIHHQELRPGFVAPPGEHGEWEQD